MVSVYHGIGPKNVLLHFIGLQNSPHFLNLIILFLAEGNLVLEEIGNCPCLLHNCFHSRLEGAFLHLIFLHFLLNLLHLLAHFSSIMVVPNSRHILLVLFANPQFPVKHLLILI